jgi:hypothetical protein
MEDKAKIYNVHIEYNDDNEGFMRNSFVGEPAVEINYFTFSKQEKKQSKKMVFSVPGKSQCFMSVSILADTPIPRVDDKGELFYVNFPKEEVRKLNNKFFMNSNIHEINYNHDSNIKLSGVYLVESFIMERGRIESPIFKDVPDGSLIQTYFVKDKKMYDRLLNDENFNGFSIEIECGIIEQFKTISPENLIKDIAFNSELSEDEKIKKIKYILNLK